MEVLAYAGFDSASIILGTMTKTIKRLVLNFPGFEPTSPIRQIGRLSSGGEKTAKLWGFDLEAGEVKEFPDQHKTVTQFKSHSETWQTDTRYVHFNWGDIIEKYESVSFPLNLVRHMPPYLAFFLDGTVFKYMKTSGRYWGFTIYPILLMIIFAILSWFVSGAVASLMGSSFIIQAVIACILFLLLCKFPGDRFYLNTSVNDWAFARDMCLQSNPEIDARYTLFANHLKEEVDNFGEGEIIIVGHSFGSVWASMALARLKENAPELIVNRKITFLALGSSLLKIALVKQASFLRDAMEQILSLPNLLWHEIQTKTDFVSFYKSDPFEPLDITPSKAEAIIHRVKFKDALTKERHGKMMRSMYLAHRQYILYCDNPVHHDYQLRIFGPFAADELARNTQLAFDTPLVTPKELTT